MNKEILLKIDGVSKKFSKDMKWNMIHGMSDVAQIAVGKTLNRTRLRKNEFWALKDINIEMSKGDVMGVMGKNGSGKSTLMRLIGGIYPIDTGQIIIDGTMAGVYAFTTGMHPYFTGRENIYIKGGMFGMSKEEIDERLPWMIEFSELDDFIDMPIGNYSAGMRNRLGFSVAVASSPDLLVLDEGIAVGDSAFKAKCLTHLKDISSNCGIIFITHSPRRLKMLANKVTIMKKGRIVHRNDDIDVGIEYYLEHVAVVKDRKYVD